MKFSSDPTLAQLADFDEIIDVRSPSEFMADHIPGAVNCPVLDDAERERVGTIYKQQSAFLAKKIGAALVSRNIANHLEQRFADKPKNWRPLVYCWRGGQRSGAMTHVLQSIGWRATRLEGGYKHYRRQVIRALEELPGRLKFTVVCGKTGCGKSRLLVALDACGSQVLDLEQIARHRGSVLGQIPTSAQPSQKYFESLLCAKLANFDPARPVYVESESKKIGALRLPDSLLSMMWESACLKLEADLPTRIELLRDDYSHFLTEPDLLNARLDRLVALHGNETIDMWRELIRQERWDDLISELVKVHYDAAYQKSIEKHFLHYPESKTFNVGHPGEAEFARIAESIAGGGA